MIVEIRIRGPRESSIRQCDGDRPVEPVQVGSTNARASLGQRSRIDGVDDVESYVLLASRAPIRLEDLKI